MTGMGSDGLEGSRAIHAAGGTVLAQDEATSAVWGMPGRVAKAGLAQAQVPLPALAAALMQRVQNVRPGGFGMRPGAETEREVLHGLL
jgi:two-component system chemotaxis response regulator CheB